MRHGGPVAAAVALALLLGVLLANLGLVTGRDTPFFRDIGTTQRPGRLLYAVLGPAAVNPFSSFGQPYAGNPNFVLGYPFPKDPRWLGLHLLLHLGIGLGGAYVFLSRLVRCREAALFGALSFGLSGYVLSSSAFLNATTTIAWIPWLLAGALAARGSEGRDLLISGAALTAITALMLLGGEPALAAIGLACAAPLALLGPALVPERRWTAEAAQPLRGSRLDPAGLRALVVLLLAVCVALLVLTPWLLEVVRASGASSRRVRGFSWAEFAAVGFHPLRFLETPFPLLFGDATRIVSGAFWGFAVTQGNPPYHLSLGFGVLPATFALLFVLSPRRGEGRLFLALLLGCLAVSLVPWLPGAAALYDALPALRVLRYPGKAMLGFGLSLSTLAAFGVDRLAVEGAVPRFRSRASWALLVLAGVFAVAAAWGRLFPSSLEGFLGLGWDPSWATPRGPVLEPVVSRLPAQAALASALLLLAVLLLRRGAQRGERLVLLSFLALELLLPGRRLLPRVPRELLDSPSPLVLQARKLGGHVYEMAGKDVDAVRRGLSGRYPWDDARSFALAQARQGWSLTGAPHGLRYAWDKDPDGSFSFLSRIASDMISSRDWPRRLKWFRSAAVTGVIASTLAETVPGLVPVVTEADVGVPATLYRVEGVLPGVRRASRAAVARSAAEAVHLFEASGFDPATDVVVWGDEVFPGQPRATPPPDVLAATSPDDRARATLASETPDLLVLDTSGSRPGILHVDRTFTPRARARVNGQTVRPFAVNVHLLGIPVPPGRARVDLELAP